MFATNEGKTLGQIKIKNSTVGSHGKRIAEENRRKVMSYFMANPNASYRKASEDIGLSCNAIMRHVRAIERQM